jgi:hypothetical protein
MDSMPQFKNVKGLNCICTMVGGRTEIIMFDLSWTLVGLPRLLGSGSLRVLIAIDILSRWMTDTSQTYL